MKAAVRRKAGRQIASTLIAIVIGLAATPHSAAAGEAARLRELESRLERSQRMIEALQARVEQLEATRTAGKAAVAEAATDPAAGIDSLEPQVSRGGTDLPSRPTDPGLPLHGFADVGLRRSGENNAAYGKGMKGFNVGTLDIYTAVQFGDRVRMLAEPTIEVGQHGEAEVDIERLQIGYDVSDLLTAWAGRFHTPFGYWNTAFHHGAQIQTSVRRPRFLDFEDLGGILPVHTMGVWLTGTVSAGGNRVGYDLFAGNGPLIRTETGNPAGPGGRATGSLDLQMAGSDSTNSSVGFNAWLSPRATPGLRLGLHGLRSSVKVIDDSDASLGLARLQLLGGYGVFTSDRWEIMGEYYRFGNRDLADTAARRHSAAWYGQAGYSTGLFTPYVRLEKASLNQADPYFAYQVNGRSYDRATVGLRYEVDPRSALKLELNRTRKRDLANAASGVPVGDDRYAETLMQYSVRF